MDKKQLQQSIDKMKKELAEMEAKLKQPERKYPVPVVDEVGYIITGEGGVTKCDYLPLSNEYFEGGNWYSTREEAQKAMEKRKAYWRVVRALRDHEGDWVANWSNPDRVKWSINYNHVADCFAPFSGWGHQVADSNLYSTREACQWVIANMKDNLRLIYDVK